ncbi:MAG: RNA 2',3'-cyclic phosphodiesterase [Beijerinckiaceae bacterium]
MPRLFTGFEVPADVGFELSMLRGGISGARWIQPEDYHVTLRFLGDIDGATARDFANALDEIQGEPLEITLDALGSFGGDRPRALIARVKPSRDLSDIQGEHERLARIVGLPPETRKFTPHVTLARLRSSNSLAVAAWLGSRALIRTIKFTAPRFVLFSSRDSTGGGPYLVEAEYPLGWEDVVAQSA